MSIRISTTIDGKQTVLRVAGRLQSMDISVLEDEIHSINGVRVLDLSELLSAEEAGIETLRSLASSGTQLRDASPYVRLLLSDGKS